MVVRMKLLHSLLACLFVYFCGFAEGYGTYIIMAPARVRPDMVYGLSVNLLQAATRVTAYMIRDNNVIASVTRQAPRGLSNISLQLPSQMQSGRYQLQVTGSGGQTFSNTTEVTFSGKAMTIIVQTDKAIYKPGQTVNLRVLAIYPNLTVYTGVFDVDVHDGKDNKIKQWKRVRGERGVVTRMLELSSQPVLGNWTVKVIAETEVADKIFTVAEYVLPQFEVTVQLPSYILVTDDSFPVTVRAKYTYGKPVAGPVTLTVNLENIPSSVRHTTQLSAQGEVIMTVLKSDLLRITQTLSNQILHASAVVTEGLTNSTQIGTATVKFYSHPYTLEFLSTNPETFQPGLDYTGFVKVTQPDGLPVTAISGQIVNVTATATFSSPRWFELRWTLTQSLPTLYVFLDQPGIAEFRFTFPSDAIKVDLRAQYKEVTSSVSIEKSYSPSNSYFQLYLRSSSVLKAGGRAIFEVKSTEDFRTLSYQVLSRGSIVASGTVILPWARTFDLPLTSDMAPNARLVCYYVRSDSEIVADSISFDLKGVFRNEVSVSVSRAEAQPAETVDVTVHASPESTAYLLAVDQSVLLLQSGNDVTQGQIVEDIKDYDSRIGGKAVPSWERLLPFSEPETRFGLPVYYEGSDATKIFENAGVLVMTDALVYKKPPPPPLNRLTDLSRLGSIYGIFRPSFLFIESALTPSRNNHNITHLGIADTLEETSLAQVERIRTLFPETWLWTNVSVNSNGISSVSTAIPDTITSWVVSAFAVSPSTGLGVAPTAAKLRVFRPFFVSLNLPYSVVRGEQVVVQAIVFNYLDTAQDVRIKMTRSENFQNILLLSGGQEQLVSENQTVDVRVGAGEGKSVYFPIAPSKLGFIDIEVSARSSVAADALRKTLLVESEGVTKEFSVSVLVDLKTSSSFSQTVPVVALPPNLVQDSTRARITAIGDLMGPTVNGLERLLNLPTGCGEQNMLGLAPDVFVTSYLKATSQLTADIAHKSTRFMEDGYQRELTYKHTDGSFSAFGNSDPSGSMWLTAFVVKTFEQAKPYICIDANVTSLAAKWIVDRQNSNGSFPEPGRVIHTQMQGGGSSSGDRLTAYVLISLLELKDLPADVNQSVTLATRKAVHYLKQRLPQISDNYVLAMTTYALTLARDPAADASFNNLLTKAVIQDGLRYWQQNPATNGSLSNGLWRSPQASAADLEMTSYVLLTYTARRDLVSGQDVMEWIVLQRNPQGGYVSTQDTVLALQALSQYARRTFSRTFNMQVSVAADDVNRQFTINQGNAMVLQSAELSEVPISLTVTAQGTGIALVTLNVFFNVLNDVERRTFAVNVTLLRDEINILRIYTCVSWLASGTSGMALQEVGIPSGFTVDVSGITKSRLLKRMELLDKKVVLYFDEIGAKSICTTMEAKRTGLVAKTQPVPVRVYDYYRPENQATTFYISQALNSSSVCIVCTECSCANRK